MKKFLMGLIGFGLGVASLVLCLDYLNAGQASACMGSKMCVDKVMRGGGKNPNDVKGLAILCAVGSVFFVMNAASNDP